GYDRCLRALTFHHRDPSQKVFPLDARNCANRSEGVLAGEAAKCDLLCANCHAEVEEEFRRLYKDIDIARNDVKRSVFEGPVAQRQSRGLEKGSRRREISA